MILILLDDYNPQALKCCEDGTYVIGGMFLLRIQLPLTLSETKGNRVFFCLLSPTACDH